MTSMELPRQPRWVYTDAGGAVDYSMEVPQREWNYGSLALGGSDVSGAGVPAAFVVRKDYLLHLTLRFFAAEWTSVERLVAHLQEGGSSQFRPDKDVPAVNHTVYGVSPILGEEIAPTRGAEPSTLDLPISIRRTTSSIFTDNYYHEPAPRFTSIVPNTGTDIGGTAVTITGAKFQTGATVTIGGAAATSIVVVSERTITCVTPAGTIGARDVVITNPDTDAGSVTAVGAFTYT